MPILASPRFYVYVLARSNGSPFYVGKGSGERVFRHEYDARSGHRCHRCNVIRKIWKQGGQVQKYIVFETDDEQEAYAFESETVALYGLSTLANARNGGMGGSSGISAESKKRIGDATRERYKNPEYRNRVIASLKASRTPEHRARMSEIAKEIHRSNPEFGAHISAKAKARYADPQTGERLRKAATERAAKRREIPKICACGSAVAKGRRQCWPCANRRKKERKSVMQFEVTP